jgi:pilus assembly protein CpaF
MKLTQRISQKSSAPAAGPVRSLATEGGQRAPRDARKDRFHELKSAVHHRLLETLDVSRLESLQAHVAAAKVTEAVSDILTKEERLITDVDRQRLISEVNNELLGLGPLEPLLWDDDITDILVNAHDQVFVEKRGKLHRTDVTFHDDHHLMLIIDRIVSQVGRRVDEASPMVDARLPDGSRINAIIPPLALDGPSLSIRRFGRRRYDIEALVENGSVTREIVPCG